MPYIPTDARSKFNGPLIKLGELVETSGELNYCLTRLAMEFLHKIVGPKATYHDLSRVHGVLQDVAAEYYRRVVAKYEDDKCEENGDVYYY